MTKKEMKETFEEEIERSFDSMKLEIRLSHSKDEKKKDEEVACLAGMIYGVLNTASLFYLFSPAETNEYHHRIYELGCEYHKGKE